MDDEFEPYPVPPTLYFGERWDAPMLDENVQQIDVPAGRSCMYCDEPIKAGERGLMRLAVRGTPENPTATQEPAHMECDLRAMIGDVAHLEGRCSCSGGVASSRARTRTGRKGSRCSTGSTRSAPRLAGIRCRHDEGPAGGLAGPSKPLLGMRCQ